MLFNSIEFFIFFLVVFLIFWRLKENLKLQSLLILVSSYFFYGWWDYRFLSLILFSSLADYFIGQKIFDSKSENTKSRFLYLSVFINLGFLFLFKYFNFFIESFNDLLDPLGYESNWTTLNIILPIGISFYTFQTLSYSIDIYNEKIEPSKDIIQFLAFVSFFPQLVAGPIERASNLLPQFTVKKSFDFDAAKNATKQIFWGFFKKVAIADNCAVFVDAIFDQYETTPPFLLLIGGLLFVLQVYCDFSGYTDIAIGTAKLLGFNLLDNFRTPLFSTSMTEFWRRWHISLSTWIRDYLFMPLTLAFRSFGRKSLLIASFISFTIFGFWHGANWTYILWGAIQGIAIIIETLCTNIKRKTKKKININIYNGGSWLLTFTFFTVTMILFRSQTIPDFYYYMSSMLAGTSNTEDLQIPKVFFGLENQINYILLFVNIILLLVLDWINRTKRYTFNFSFQPKFIVYFYVLHEIIRNFFSEVAFVYFQF